MNFNKIKKNIALVFSISFLGAFSVNASTLNDLPDENKIPLEKEIISLFKDSSMPNTSNASIESIKRIDNSDNYIFKYKEGENYYTMMYMQDIKSVFIQSTSEIFSLEDKDFITQKFNSGFLKTFMKDIDLKESITFEGKDKTKSDEIFVFTDPTCGYCQKLHREISDYQNQNITIHYLPFPRGGTTGHAYNQLVNTYCATDKKAAFEEAKTLNIVPAMKEGITQEEVNQCKETVNKYYNLGVKMGIRGTPAIFSENGTQLGGYVPAMQLRFAIDGDKSNK